jgi:hypothetical protein
MWHRQRRLRQLENEVAEARAGQAELMQRVQMFEEIAAAAGVALEDAVDAVPVPPGLLAAARGPRRKCATVRLDVDRRVAIAVIGDEGGDPDEWWMAIRRLAAQRRSVSALHLEQVVLPEGLTTVAFQDPHSELVVYVSQTQDTDRQRAAVMAAIRAARGATGWRAGLPTAGVALLVALSAMLRRVPGAVSARPMAWGAAATATIVGASTAGVLLTTAPHQHRAVAAGRPSPAGTALPPLLQAQQRGHPRVRDLVRPVAAAGSSAGAVRVRPGRHPGPAGPSPSSAPAPRSSPSPSPSSPMASPSPTPSPSGGAAGVCVVVLGVRVCLPPVSLSPSD